jgi:hypothetical protein
MTTETEEEDIHMAKTDKGNKGNLAAKMAKAEAAVAAAAAKKEAAKRKKAAASTIEVERDRQVYENIWGEKFARERVAALAKELVLDILFEGPGRPRRAFSDPSVNDAITNAVILIDEGREELSKLWLDQDEAVAKIERGLKKFGKRAELRRFTHAAGDLAAELRKLGAPVERTEPWPFEAVAAADLDELPSRLARGWNTVVQDLRGALNHRGIRTKLTVKLGGTLHPSSIASDAEFEVRMHRANASNRWYPEVEGAARNNRTWRVGGLYPTVNVEGLPASGVDKEDVGDWGACEGASPYAYWRKIPGVKWSTQAGVLKQSTKPRLLKVGGAVYSIKKVEVRAVAG